MGGSGRFWLRRWQWQQGCVCVCVSQPVASQSIVPLGSGSTTCILAPFSPGLSDTSLWRVACECSCKWRWWLWLWLCVWQWWGGKSQLHSQVTQTVTHAHTQTVNLPPTIALQIGKYTPTHTHR